MSRDDFEPSDEESAKAVTAERKKEEKRAERDISDLRKVLSSVEGRRLIWRWLTKGGMFRCSFVPNANETAFNEGRRAWANEMMAEMDLHAPGQLVTALKESQGDHLR